MTSHSSPGSATSISSTDGLNTKTVIHKIPVRARRWGEKNTILQKLNSLEYGSTKAFYDGLYDTQQIVEEFYEEFEDLRLDLVQEVVGIPDDRGDAKQRYVQVTLDRMIFLFSFRKNDSSIGIQSI